jgi:hypothetical protein
MSDHRQCRCCPPVRLRGGLYCGVARRSQPEQRPTEANARNSGRSVLDASRRLVHGIEEQHYHLFLRFLGVSEGPIPSVVYFSVESFDARRNMVDRMARDFLWTPELNGEWGELNKALKDANEARNSIAHYSIYWTAYERTVGESVELEIRGPSIGPSLYNRVSAILGRTTHPDHNLGADKIDGWIRRFGDLADRIAKFREALLRSPAKPQPLPKPPPPTPPITPPPPLNSKSKPEPSG